MSGPWLRILTTSLLVVAAVGLVAGVVYDQQSTTLSSDEINVAPERGQSAAPTPTGPAPGPAGAATSFAVLGDAFSTGDGVPPGRGWVEQFSQDMCWALTDRSAEPGTGYLFGGGEGAPETKSYQDRIANVVGGHPQVVIVQGGADELTSPDQISAAASNTFAALRSQLGDQATIVAIGPVPTPAQNGPALAPASAAIANAAVNYGVTYVDPVAEGWLAAPDYFLPDQPLPNEQGYVEFAKRLEASLRQQGIKPSGACG